MIATCMRDGIMFDTTYGEIDGACPLCNLKRRFIGEKYKSNSNFPKGHPLGAKGHA